MSNRKSNGCVEGSDPQVTTLRGYTILARKNGSPLQYVNRTQAQRKASEVNGEVIGPRSMFARGFYVAVGKAPEACTQVSGPIADADCVTEPVTENCTRKFDDVALSEIRHFVGMSRGALEEAECYFDQMTDKSKRAEARRLLDNS
jgi:hypothetical protein